MLEKKVNKQGEVLHSMKSEMNGLKEMIQIMAAKMDSLVTIKNATSTEGKLPAQAEQNPRAQCGAITTRSRNVLEPILPTPRRNYVPPAMRNGMHNIPEHAETSRAHKEVHDNQTKGVTPESVVEQKQDSQKSYQKIPFPERFEKTKEEKQFAKFLEKMKEVQVTIPILDVVLHVPMYAKFFKDLISKKRSLEEPEVITLTKHSSAIIQNTLPQKLDDPGSFCIPCMVGTKKFTALCDLGSSVSVIPLSVSKTLSLGELQSTPLMLQLANRTFRKPAGMLFDVLITVDTFSYLADFVVLEMEDNS